MPWQVQPMSDIRLAFIHQVLTLKVPLAVACRQFSISRKTGYKWLRRFHDQPGQSLVDHSRRPKSSPRKTAQDIEQKILAVRDEFTWAGPKIHKILSDRGLDMPSVRTITNILKRNNRVKSKLPQAPLQRFERAQPNELWQLDHKGPLEIVRQKVYPLAILDDHSRYLLCLKPYIDMLHITVWQCLWELMGQVGMPEAILCDNFYKPRGHSSAGLSWFDSRLLRLGIQPAHCRPYHPQTQGKLERINRTMEQEVWAKADRSSLIAFAASLENWRSEVYNTLRPHEALGMKTPISLWTPSARKRPDRLPELEYPYGSLLRKVHSSGIITYRSCRILIGAGVAGDTVRLEENNSTLEIYYAHKKIRTIASSQLIRYTTV